MYLQQVLGYSALRSGLRSCRWRQASSPSLRPLPGWSAASARPSLIAGPLVAGLLADNARVRALTRSPAAASFSPGVEVADGDYAAPGLLAEAVRGADAVFVNIGALREHSGELSAAARMAKVLPTPGAVPR